MSSNNLSQELFFPVHRGVNVSYPHYTQDGDKSQYALDASNLGTHWSADEQVAKEFANNPNSRSFDPSWRTKYGHVIHANVPMSSVETDVPTLQAGGYANLGGKDPFKEKEVMAKPAHPVEVTGVTKLRASGEKVKARKRTYNPPRKAWT